MAARNFSKALPRVLVYEGGKVDDPDDPGGRTAYGVTQATYDTYRRKTGGHVRDVWLISQTEVASIYKSMYWDRVGGDQLPEGVDFAAFDAAVNSGVAQSTKWLQRAMPSYTGQVDGDFGPRTVAAVKDDPDHDLLIARMTALRLGTLKGLRTWSRFGGGWSARIANVKKIGQAWATGSVGPDPIVVVGVGGNRKAVVSTLTMREPMVSATSAQVASAASAAGATITEISGQFAGFQEQVAWLKWGLLGLAVAGVLVGIVAKIAQAKADAAKNTEATATVDPEADQGFPNISPDRLPDFTPATQEG